MKPMTKRTMAKRAAIAIGLVAFILVPSMLKIGSFFFDTLFIGNAARDVRSAQSRAYPKIIEDLKAWSSSTMAQALAGRERDAGPALNRKLEWKGDVAGFDLEPLSTPDGAALMAACESFPECGEDAFAALNLATNAYDVFSQATEFDHWNINAASPIETLAKSGRIAMDSRKPTPDYRRLRGLARTYLFGVLRGKDAAAATEAFSQVAHMGALLITQQTADSAAAGLAMLADVRAGLEVAANSTLVDPAAIPTPSTEDVQRFERLAQAIPAFFSPLTDPKQLDQILALDRTGAFICIGATHQFAPEGVALISYAEPTIPGEVDYQPYIAVVEKLLAPSSPCQISFERETWARRESLQAQMGDLGGVRSLPWLRRSYFLLRATASAAETSGQIANYDSGASTMSQSASSSSAPVAAQPPVTPPAAAPAPVEAPVAAAPSSNGDSNGK